MSEVFRRRHLPHWDVAGAPYFVTACLAGSTATCLRELEVHRRELDSRPRPAEISESDWDHRNRKLLFAKLDDLLDDRPAVCHLATPDLARIVRDALRHFAGVRYRLLAYVVMPSHLHCVFAPLPEWCETLRPGRTPREIITHSLKSYTANLCNRSLGIRGPFWQDESYDHWVRDDDEVTRIIHYIEYNPVKAGLASDPAEFEFSSAFGRAEATAAP